MENKILEVKNLNVVLDGEKIIEDLSFDLKEGEILTVLGPNGAGKTVLIKAILGLLPYQGEIKWNNVPRIGYLPQGFTQWTLKDLPLSVEEFFLLKKKDKTQALQFLKSVGIEETSFFKKRVSNLSSGQFQRLLIAWVLIDKPNVLFFDEPTTGIDIGGEETIYTLLQKVRQEEKITILLVVHDLNVVYRHSINVLCFNKKMICYGKPRDILTPAVLAETYGSEIKFYEHHH